MNNGWNLIELGDLGVLRLRGPDGVRFLQGQVSNNVERLSAEASQLAGYHNPQGRTIALLRLVRLAPDDLLAILPRELVTPVANRLTKFVLRAKVKVTDESDNWRVTGLVAPHRVGDHLVGETPPPGSAVEHPADDASASRSTSTSADPSDAASIEGAFESRARTWAAAQFEEANALAATVGERNSAAAQLEQGDAVVELPTASALMLPDTLNAQSSAGTTLIISVGATQRRWLLISPANEALPLSGCVVGDRDAWRLLDIADGAPQVYGATSEEFVAQMLNLDALGAIAFDKGCYTGQEVIARAHYRGRVKRRLQRFMTRSPVKLAINDSGVMTDGRAFKVVEAAQLSNGRCEFLAVAPLPGATSGEAGDGSPQAAALPSAEVGHSSQGDRLELDVLPLPYQLPE